MRNFKFLSSIEKEQIKQEKLNNPFIKISELSKKYELYETTLNNFLNKNGLTTQKLTGVRYRKYNVNDNYFQKIDSHNKAYLLGVWYSDGYLVKEGITKRIGLDVKDSDWLSDIGKELQSEAPLYKTQKDELKRLKITSPKMYDDLIRLGCFENKTFLLKFPSDNIVPREFINSFILGLIDGDGSIEITKPRKENWSSGAKITLTGTKEILEGAKKVLRKDYLQLYQRFPERKNNNYTLQITGIHQVASILSLLYENAPSFCLKRKYEKYIKIINDSRVDLKKSMFILANPNDNGV